MRLLMIFTIGLFLFSASFTVVRGQTGDVKIAFVKRAKMFKLQSGIDRSLTPEEENHVMLIIRVKGTPMKNINSEQKPYVEFDDTVHEAEFTQTIGELTMKNNDKEITVKPWIVLVFAIPDTERKVKLVINNCNPVYVTAPTEISKELSHFDILDAIK